MTRRNVRHGGRLLGGVTLAFSIAPTWASADVMNGVAGVAVSVVGSPPIATVGPIPKIEPVLALDEHSADAAGSPRRLVTASVWERERRIATRRSGAHGAIDRVRDLRGPWR